MFEQRQPRPIFRNLSAQAQNRPQGSDLSDYVLTLHTHKTLSSAAGTWEVQLVPFPQEGGHGVTSANWESYIYQTIRPMDAVTLGVNCVDQAGNVRDQIFMFGFVDSVYKTKSTYGDRVQRGITVRGRDATKLFIEDQVANAPELATDERITDEKALGAKRAQFLDFIRGMVGKGDKAKNVFIGSNPPEAIKWVLDYMPAMRIALPYKSGLSEPHEIFKVALSAYADDTIFDEQMNMYAGTVMNYFAQLIDPMFYELWIDTLPADSPLNDSGHDRPIMICRPKPYDHRYEVDSWAHPIRYDAMRYDPATGTTGIVLNALPTWEALTSPITGEAATIHEWEILEKGLGVSDEEVFTMYKLFGSKDPIAVSTVGKYGFYFPLLDTLTTQVYGLRELQGQSRMIGFAGDWVQRTQSNPKIVDSYKIGHGAFNIPLIKQGPLVLTFEQVQDIIRGEIYGDMNTTGVADFLTREKRDRLWRWNRYNHILESGTATVMGRQIFVGTKVILPEETPRPSDHLKNRNTYAGMEFYCTGVEQSYSYGSPWTTRLTLPRGHNPQALQDYHDFRQFGKEAGPANYVYSANKDRMF
jgi:hypothetical protein